MGPGQSSGRIDDGEGDEEDDLERKCAVAFTIDVREIGKRIGNMELHKVFDLPPSMVGIELGEEGGRNEYASVDAQPQNDAPKFALRASDDAPVDIIQPCGPTTGASPPLPSISQTAPGSPSTATTGGVEDEELDALLELSDAQQKKKHHQQKQPQQHRRADAAPTKSADWLDDVLSEL